MEFGIEKCAMLIIKSRKIKTTEGTELPNQERNRTLRKTGNYEYLGMLGVDKIKQAEIKEKGKKRVLYSS